MSDPIVLEDGAPRHSGGRRKRRFSGCLPMLAFVVVAAVLIAAAANYVVRPWFEDLFADARLNPHASLITGVVCGVRVEDIDDPLMQKIRYLDKLVDELAKGRKMEKILRRQAC